MLLFKGQVGKRLRSDSAAGRKPGENVSTMEAKRKRLFQERINSVKYCRKSNRIRPDKHPL